MTDTIAKEAPNKFYGLDNLRALAIILVTVFHYQLWFAHPVWTKWFMQIGWTGVDLFFVLSGFLISSQLFAQIQKGKPISIQDFFIKRFFRIIPIYFFIVAIYFLFPFVREKEALPPLWTFLTFTQNFGTDTKVFGTLSHVWSLCVEEHFYLLFPFTLIFLQYIDFFKKSWWLLIALFLFGFVIRLYLWNTYLPNGLGDHPRSYWVTIIYAPTYNRLDGLLAGVSIAAIYQFMPTVWNRISRLGNYCIAIGALILIGAYFFCTDLATFSTSIVGFPVLAIGYGFLVAGAISPVSFLYKLNSTIGTLIATLSYSMYLSHKSVIHVVQKVFSNLAIDKDGNVMFLIGMIFCVLVAWLLHLAIEKPFMKWRDGFLKKKNA